MKKVILSLVLLVSAMQVGCGSKSASELNATLSPLAACQAKFAAQDTSAFLSDNPAGSCCTMVYDPTNYVPSSCEYIIGPNAPQYNTYGGTYNFNAFVLNDYPPFSLMGELSNMCNDAISACQANITSGSGCSSVGNNSPACQDTCPPNGC
ncbi:MAG: hypothetical protein WCK42_05220 [Myxococcaceae bacterium]